jgi:hypothetical protein
MDLKTNFFTISKFCTPLFIKKAIFIANPISNFPVYDIIYTHNSFKHLFHGKVKAAYFYKLLARVIVVSLCFAICYVSPSFNDFIGFIGSFVLMFIGIVLPLVVYLKAFEGKCTTADKYSIYILLVVNCGIWVIATYSSLKDIFDPDN